MATATKVHEYRAATFVKVQPEQHFFYDNNPVKSFGDVGKIHGLVKIALLATGRVSLRSLGKHGTGKTVYTSRRANIIVDGVTWNVVSYFNSI